MLLYVLAGLNIIIGLPAAIFNTLHLINKLGNKKRNGEEDNHT
jgi:hypothetical protein